MSTGNTFSLAMANHLLMNATVPNVGDATGLNPSTGAGSLFVSLHTADPGSAGTQATNEVAYTGYARSAVTRASGQWTTGNGASNATFSNVNPVTFGQDTAGTPVITYFAIGTATSGTGELIASGALSASLTMAIGITPSFAAGQLSGTFG